MLNMAGKAQVGLVIVFAIAVTASSLVSTRPKLTIFPAQNPLLAPTRTSLGLTCGVSADEEGDFTSMKWFNPDGEEIPEDSSNVNKLGSKLKLTFYEPRAEDSGIYKCTALFSNTVTVEAEIKIEFYVKPNIVAFENLTREETKDAVLECRAEGFPKPTMTLRKDRRNGNIVDNEVDGMELEVIDEDEFRVLRLTITNVKRSDQGLYYCKASNDNGYAERVGHLEVKFRPDMSRTQNTSVTTWSPNPANLSCIAEANPNASITWKFQGDPIELGDDRFKIFGSVSYSNLLVMTANRPHNDVFGKYTCEARNSLGENSIDITLDEATVPGQITQIVFDRVTPTTITFRLLGPANNGGMPITYYIIRYKTTDESHDKIITVEWPKGEPYFLSNLKPRAKYQFGVAARNEVGDGPWKTVEYIMPEVTVPEAPLIKLNQETISIYPDIFEVHWEAPNDNGSPILKYLIRYFKVDLSKDGWTQQENAKELVVGSDILTCNITGLAPDTFYKIEIRANNQIGYSLPGTVVIKTSKDNNTDDTSSIRSVQAVKITSNSIVFKIVTSGSQDSIEVKYLESQNVTEYQAKWKRGDVYEIKDLIPSGRYSFQFRTIPLDGIWSEIYEVTLLPNPPEVIFQSLRGNSATVMWFRTIDDDVRKTIDKYQLIYYTLEIYRAKDWIPNKCAITIELPYCAGNSYTISGLNSKVYYEIQLRAHTVSGYGEPYKQKLYIQ